MAGIKDDVVIGGITFIWHRCVALLYVQFFIEPYITIAEYVSHSFVILENMLMQMLLLQHTGRMGNQQYKSATQERMSSIIAAWGIIQKKYNG
ncbi:MAG TPA: hypothetical protein VMT76_07175 [Puia sp.]|nr:hypothetical protein [Puia sp.]